MFDDEKEDGGKYLSPAAYLLSEILNALVWHVHLCSHQSIVDILPKESPAAMGLIRRP